MLKRSFAVLALSVAVLFGATAPSPARAEELPVGSAQASIQECDERQGQADASVSAVAGDVEPASVSPEVTADGEGVADAVDDTLVEEQAAPEAISDESTADEDPQPVLQTSVDSPDLPDLPDLPEGAITIEEGAYVIQTQIAQNLVVDANGKTPKSGANVSTWTYNGNNNQTWVIQEVSDGWHSVRLRTSGGEDGLALSADAKGNVCVTDAKESQLSPSSLWSFVDAGDGLIRLTCAAYPGKCLDVSGNSTKAGANLLLWNVKSTAAPNQLFWLVERNPVVRASDVSAEGTYQLALAGTSYVADIESASQANGASALLWTVNGKQNQKFVLERDEDGYYTVWAVGSGKVLDVAKSCVLPGTTVLQWTHSGNDNQLWALRELSDGSYSLVNKATGLALGVTSSARGTHLVGVCPTRGDALCAFELVQTELIAEGINLVRPRTTSAVALDVRSASTGTADLILWTNSGALNQRYEFVNVGEADVWRIRTGSSGGWLTWTGANTVVQKGKGSTQASASDTWRAVFVNGGVSLVNVASEQKGTPLALDMKGGSTAKGTNIIAWSVNGRDSQHFVFEPAQLLKEGSYFLQASDGRYLELTGTAASDTGVRLGNRSGKVEQYFDLIRSGSSWCITNFFNGKRLQVNGSASGAGIVQATASNSRFQLWNVAIADGGRVAFESVALPGCFLEPSSTTSGGLVACAEDTSVTAPQSWKLIGLSDASTQALTSRQKAVVNAAKRTPSPGAGLCAGWVTNVFENAGIGVWYGDACDQYRYYCKSSDLASIRPGMIVAVSSHSHSSAGKRYGHVAIYIGDGLVMDNVGKIRTMALTDWIAYYGDRVTPKWGWFGNKALC